MGPVEWEGTEREALTHSPPSDPSYHWGGTPPPPPRTCAHVLPPAKARVRKLMAAARGHMLVRGGA